MNHIDFIETPITYLNYFSNRYSINIYCKRDDMFAYAGGGNKARMLHYILYPLLKDKIQTIVTAGGPNSNFNRALALMCAEYGLNLKIVSYTDHEEEYIRSLNNTIVTKTKADYIYCKKNEVVDVISEVLNECESHSLKYRYIYGGGRSIEGIYAYYDAVKSLTLQTNVRFDHVVVACGTGTTVAGICAGFHDFFPDARIHAISVARTRTIEEPILIEDLEMLGDYMGRKYDISNIDFHEDYLLGGYAVKNDLLVASINEAIANQGLLLDSTYSGKAFWGMVDLFHRGTIAKSSNVLFWHTGGLFNLLSDLKTE